MAEEKRVRVINLMVTSFFGKIAEMRFSELLVMCETECEGAMDDLAAMLKVLNIELNELQSKVDLMML